MKQREDPLFAPPKKKHPARGLIILLLAVIIAVTVVLNSINNSRVNLLTQKVTVPNLPASLENFRILHISDLHGLFFGPHQERIATALQDARYNVVCVTGDITGPDGNIDAFLALLDLFRDKAPVYFIPGDEDPAPVAYSANDGGRGKAAYVLAAESHGGIYLDAPVKIQVGRANLWLAPDWVYTLDYSASQSAYTARRDALLAQEPSPDREAGLAAVEYQLDQLSRIRAARLETLESDVHVVLTHHPLQPSALQSLQEWSPHDMESYVRTVSLVLAGHYVGGQWRLPGIGAVRAPLSSGLGNHGWFPDDRQVVGLNTVMGVSQYISPGLGTSSAIGLPGVRLFNTPAVTVLTLTSKLTQ